MSHLLQNILKSNIPDDVRIIGIDPGSTKVGVSCLSFSAMTSRIISTTAFTLTGNKSFGLDSWEIQSHGERFARISALCNELSNIFAINQPNYIVCEAPFYNPRMPMAYGVLVEVVQAIRQTVNAYHPLMALETIDPSSVKNAVGSGGAAKKENIQAAVLSMQQLNYFGPIPQGQLDEHSIDAIAVAYSKYKKCLGYFI